MSPISPDRARGAFLGLALGDAYGRSLEFIRGSRVRTRTVSIPSRDFMWTDDTHMALYLADALASLGRTGLTAPSDDAVGSAVGSAFVQWSRDPLTPSTAPGNTCLSGTAAFARSGDWRTSGVRTSDGCGAVMRIAPLPIVLSGEALELAARVQALVTHAHPNAPAAAVAASLLLRRVLEGHPLDEAAVRVVQERLHTVGAGTHAVHAALDAAVAQAARPELDWLDEADIPDGDGGWRSPSALGLALVAALRWKDRPAVAIEKAARIDGDSDSVACLTGMFLGALHGVSGLPSTWLDALPQRDRIEAAVSSLLALTPSHRAARYRTSETHPIEVAWVDADVDGGGGRLGVTLAPGKKARSHTGPPWDRDLDTDLDRLAQLHKVDVLVSLVEDAELGWLRIPDLVAQAEARGIAVLRLPIEDCSVPDPSKAAQIVQAAVSMARAGLRVVFHCRGGIGRAGTLAACALRAMGAEARPAIAQVRAVRPKAVETPGQVRFVDAFRPQPTTPG